MKEKIKQEVILWMESYEPGTFVKNEHGAYIYSAGHSSINIEIFFQELLEDFIETNNIEIK